MTLVLVLLTLTASPDLLSDSTATDAVDLLELNHHIFSSSPPFFRTQLILYDWRPDLRRYQVRGWVLLNSREQYPYYDLRRKCWMASWMDYEYSRMPDHLKTENSKSFVARLFRREIIARRFLETYTPEDPELIERRILPEEKRRGLSSPVGGLAP